MIDQLWREDGLCREVDPDLFFTTGKDPVNVARARAICGDCMVQHECLLAGLASPGEFGIWGGTTKDERNVMHEEMREARRARKRMRNTARLQTLAA
jgi:hypothetical protein